MSDASNRAVFLSYASQDADAARRICEALRAAGVEVWFDQSELRGGDAWDAKIRKQIKECALFVPVISANTQARLEGYFRLEWRLADQRSHLMAKGKAFLLPAVIDATRDSEAHVPDSFLEVQWTRLRDEETNIAFAQRVGALLGSRMAPPNAAQPSRSSAAAPVRAFRHSKRTLAVTGIAFAIIVAAAAVWQLRPKAEAELDARLEARLLRGSREETGMAEEAMRRLTEKEPHSAAAWSARAFVQSVYLTRGWDNGDKRRQDAQTFARNALTIDPNDTRAILVLAKVFISQGAYQEAEAMARRALTVRADEPAAGSTLAAALSGQGRFEDARAELQEAIKLHPDSSGARYQFALLYETLPEPDFEAALRSFEAARTARRDPEPPANILIHEAALVAGVNGDLPAARALLDRVSPVDRMEDRAVGTAMTLGLLERQPARVTAAGAQTARDYFEDLYVPGPKAWRLALAHRIEGKESLARQEWQRAEVVLRQRLAVTPGNQNDQAALAATLAWLGRREEAEKLMAPIEAQVRESPPRISGFAPDHLRLLYLGYYYAGLGEANSAAPYVRRLLNRRELLTTKTIPFDPWWDKIRDQPDFKALLERVSEKSAATSNPAAPEPKSIAVLPFKNLSGDKEQEYFSDGLTEGVLNALAAERDLRVPGRTSSFAFKGKTASVAEIAKALNVAQLVEGSVQRMGNHVRIQLELTRARDGFTESLGTFNGEVKDGAAMFALQDDVARAVVAKLTRRSGLEATAVLTKNADAYEAYLRGRALQTRSGPSTADAIPLFERAVSLDPEFALAWARLAEVRYRPIQGLTDNSPEVINGTKEAIEHALRLQPNLPVALIARANWTRAVAGDLTAAEADLERAASLAPVSAELRYAQMHLAYERGDWSAFKRLARETLALDPQNGDYANVIAVRFNRLGDYAEADRLFARAIAIQGTTNAAPFQNRVWLRERWRGPEAALQLVERYPATWPGYDIARARILADLGRREEARPLVQRISNEMFRRLRMVSLVADAGDEDGARRQAAAARELSVRQLDAGNRALRVRDRLIESEIILGHRESALQALAEWQREVEALPNILQRSDEFSLFAGNAADHYARLGDADRAVALMRAAMEHGIHPGLGLKYQPDYALVRGDARFQELVAKAEAWAKQQPDPVDD